MTTTNNLIGYDPLAWMDAEVEGEVVEEVAPEPVKKATRSKAKAKAAPVEITEDTTVMEETLEELSNVEAEDDNVEVDVNIDEEGEIEITIDADESVDVVVEIAVETDAAESENDVLEAPIESISETSEDVTELEVEAVTEEIIGPLVELGVDATLKTLSLLHENFKRVLVAHDVIEINASDVATIDTATFQLLVSLKKDAPRLNKTITIIYPSKRFIESAKLLDLLTILEITE